MATKICQKCGESKSTANYIASNSKIHGGSLPICRQCISKMIAEAPEDDRWNLVDKLCQWADIPFIPDQWEKIYKGHGKEAFGMYASIFRSSSYDTLDWSMYNKVYLQLEEEDRVSDAIPYIKEKEERRLLQKWGQNYDRSELEYLENLHQGMLNSQNIVGALNEDQALKLCKISLIIEQKIRGGADFSKDLKAYDDLSKLANFTPKIIQNADEFSSIGELCAYLEKKGWVNEYYDEVDRDEVDFCIKDIKYWLQYLYATETGIAEEIEQRIQNLKVGAAAQGIEFNENDFRDYIREQGNERISEEEFKLDV